MIPIKKPFHFSFAANDTSIVQDKIFLYLVEYIKILTFFLQ